MSQTLVDMAKVTQMLDTGWTVKLFKNSMQSYTAQAKHKNRDIIEKANRSEVELCSQELRDVVAEDQYADRIETDDFTPEQALTRLAYKVHGEII